MRINLNQNKNLKLFKSISTIAAQNKQTVYIVGGYVRDLLMGRKVATDIDFVTEQNGIELAQKIASQVAPNQKVSIFKTYGTAMFHYKDLELEFVGARKESYSEDSRNPSVESGTLEDDQKRRDFTINAMAISLNKDNFGELIDPFDGQKDLQNKVLRTPLEPQKTYSDDPLRMMRAIRFASTLDFTIEENSLEAIRSEAERIKIVSMERIMVEFNKILLSTQPSKGLTLLDEVGFLDYLLPELTALKGIEVIDGQSHKDNFYHTLQVVDNVAKYSDNVWLRWAGLLHDIGKAPTKKFVEGVGWTFYGHEALGGAKVKGIFKRLKLPLGSSLKYVQKLVRMHARPIALVTDDTSDAALRRLLFDAEDDLEDLLKLCKSDITTKNTFKLKKYQQHFEHVANKIKQIEEKDKIRNFQPPISGEEIMEFFSIQPGREIGILKEKVKEAILDGLIENDQQQAKAFVIEEAKKLNLTPKN